MSLRLRFAVYALAVVGAVVLGLYLGASRVLLQSFTRLENEQMLANLGRAEAAWQRDAVHLTDTARGYAARDDTYSFIADRNPGYLDKLGSDTVKNLNVNFLVLTDASGALVAARAFNLEWSVPVPLPESVKTYLGGNGVQRRTSGLVVLPDAVLLVASAPIVTSEFRGPVRGAVVIGKFIDARVARTFGNQVQLGVKFYRLDDDTLAPDVLAAKGELLAQGGSLSRPLSETQVAGYTLLNDLTGKPALLLQIEAPRPIYAQALRSRRILTALTLLVGILAGLALLFLLQRGMLRRFTRLSTAVKEIAESGDTTRRVVLPGRDELAGVGHDINLMLASLAEAQGNLRESEARYARVEQGASDGLWDWNLETDLVYYSPRYAAMLGYSEAARYESPALFLNAVHPDDQERVKQLIDEHVTGVTPKLEGEFRVATQPAPLASTSELSSDPAPSAPEYRWVLGRGVAVYEGGVAVSLAGSLTDLSQRGVFDPLTGLPNRLFLRRHLAQLLNPCPNSKVPPTALLFLDLNRFKMINDSLGHYVGDLLLSEVGRRLQRAVRRGDLVARLGGDEFVVLLQNVTRTGVENALRRVSAALAEPYVLNTHPTQTSASIGVVWPIAEYPAGGVEDLLRDADVAMYEAKKAHQPYLYFDKKMREQLVARQQLEADLRQALSRREFFLVYQPIVSLAEGGVPAFEALVRWQHPTRGLVSPAEFIPLAEETGLIVELGRWILESVCERLQSRPEQLAGQVTVAVNLSPRQLGDPELAAWLAALLARTGVAAARLKLEITEGAVMEHPERMIGLLRQLRDLGFKLAMDDFGTGYSSLSYVHDLPIHTLKIDRSFVSRLTCDRKSLEIVRTIMALAERLGLEVVAEGVETEAQVTLLQELGCTLMQGYYYSKPLPWEDLGALPHAHYGKVTPSALVN